MKKKKREERVEAARCSVGSLVVGVCAFPLHVCTYVG